MLKAGFARLDVTPPLGTPLTGYFYPRISDGILDPISLNAIVVADDKNTAMILTGDFMYCSGKLWAEIRNAISEKTGIDADSILAQSIHQHTTTTPDTIKDTHPEYFSLLKEKLLNVAQMAINDLSEATASYGEKDTAEPVSFIRRFWMKDGSISTNPQPMNPDIVGPNGEADNTVRLIKFTREGKNDIALVQFQTHPDVIGGNKYSADWPGFVRTYIEAEHPNVSCLLLNGFQGDVNHYDVKKPRPATAEERYNHSKFMGRLIADAALKALADLRPICCEGISGKVVPIYMATNTAGIEKIDEAMHIRKDFEAGKLGATATLPIVEAFRVTNMLWRTILQTVYVTVIGLGDVSVIGFSGEPFVQYAADLRDAMPEKKLLFACLANGAIGYFPSAQAYDEGGYEVTTAILPKEIAPKLYNTALEMLKEI